MFWTEGPRRSALLAALLLAPALFACGEAAEEPMAESMAAADGSVRLTEAQVQAAGIVTTSIASQTIAQPVRVPGSVQSPDTAYAAVGSIVEGRVLAVHVLPGDVVRRGQPLVEIHSHELDTANRDLTAAEAEVSFHRNALERSQQLLEAGAVSLEEVERRQSDFQGAEAELRRAQEMVEHLNPSPRGNVVAVAPRNGTVFTVEARPGQAVLPGSPLLEMGSTTVLWVTAFVPENTSSNLEVGDVVQVTFRSLDELQVSARLVRTSNFVDPANRSVEMRFELDSIPDGVRPGSFAVVDVATSESFEGVELDEDAAVRIGEEDIVFVQLSPGVYRPTPVATVQLRTGTVAVRGLPPGAEIVVEGAYFLKAALESEAESGEGA